MPVVGTRKDSSNVGRGWAKNPNHKLAVAFLEVVNGIRDNTQFDLFTESTKVMMNKQSQNAMKRFFTEDTIDMEDPEFLGDPEKAEDALLSMEEQFTNNSQALLEYTSMATHNPVIGLAFPIHKNILMNNIFDKGAIPKAVAREPKFTISMDKKILITTDGREIDMFTQQNEMSDAINKTAPFKDTVLSLPENETTDVLATTFGASSQDDSLAIDSGVTKVVTMAYCEVAAGDKKYNVLTNKETVVTADGFNPVLVTISKATFVPAYGPIDRQMMKPVTIKVKDFVASVVTTKTISFTLSGYMLKNKIMLMSTSPLITAAIFSARVDTSNAMIKTCSVTWKTTTDMVEIPHGVPINVPVSPDEIKDVSALYQVNQLTKIMSLMSEALGNFKDDTIHSKLDESFITMPNERKIASTFDFAPPDNYALDHITWRNVAFMDALETDITTLLQVLNDPNMTVTVIGRPGLINKVTPTEFTYQSPANIGPVELSFQKTVTSSNRRTYHFISSDKLRDTNNLIVLLCPHNSERIVYKIYDYQMYVSNEIRNVTNYALPSIHAYERWTFFEYQSVQGRIKILNPRGVREMKDLNFNTTPQNGMNDFTANNDFTA